MEQIGKLIMVGGIFPSKIVRIILYLLSRQIRKKKLREICFELILIGKIILIY